MARETYFGDHHVAVEGASTVHRLWRGHMMSKTCDHPRAEGEVRHKMTYLAGVDRERQKQEPPSAGTETISGQHTVHDVDVEPVAVALDRVGTCLAECGKVGRKDRRRDDRCRWLSHLCCSSLSSSGLDLVVRCPLPGGHAQRCSEAMEAFDRNRLKGNLTRHVQKSCVRISFLPRVCVSYEFWYNRATADLGFLSTVS